MRLQALSPQVGDEIRAQQTDAVPAAEDRGKGGRGETDKKQRRNERAETLPQNRLKVEETRDLSRSAMLDA
jgi:hypothetical protein